MFVILLIASLSTELISFKRDKIFSLIEEENIYLNNLLDRITEISKKIDKIYLDNVNGLISNDDYFRYSKEFIKEKDRLRKEKLNTENKINTLKEKQTSNENDEEIEKVINQFLRMEKPSKKILYEIVDRVELDEYKNIYIYFNFSELDITNKDLSEMCLIKLVK